MGKSKLYLLVTVMLFELASCSSGCKLQSDKDEKTCSSCKWEVISDSMLSVQLKIAPYAYEVSVHNREARRNRDLLHFLSNNVEASDTIVFIEPIDGLTTKPWTLGVMHVYQAKGIPCISIAYVVWMCITTLY